MKNLALDPISATAPRALGVVFRVTGIPLSTTVDQLNTVLSREFQSGTQVLDTSETTICESCYDDATQTALIQFTPSSPILLESLPHNDSYQLDFGDGNEISIDKDFYGLTQLYPTSGIIKADVVAVCGLDGHAYGSWASKIDHRGRRKMWLRHFLAQDLPHCRVMIYGYNSKLSHKSIHTIPDYTDNFLEELLKARGLNEDRPIVFIGHSFGGIIISQSIVEAKDNQARYGRLITSTRGTIFFGTPHRGLVVDDILAMIGEDSPREGLVTSLQSGAEALQTELKRFINYSSILNLKIISFKETGLTRKLVKDSNGRWSRNGEYFTAVESSSSVLQLPDSIEESLAVEGDHSTLVKFKHKGERSYTSVVRHLKNLTLDSGAESRYLTPFSAVINQSARDLQRVLGNTTVDLNKPVTHGGQVTTLLHIASTGGDENTVTVLLKHGADINALDNAGHTVFLAAARRGDIKMVELLLRNGADITTTTRDKLSALHYAAGTGNKEMTEVLLRNGADVTTKCSVGMKNTNTHYQIILNEKYEPSKTLLEYGANIETPLGSWNALHFAARSGNTEVVEMLLGSGADAMAEGGISLTRGGCNALILASNAGHVKVVELLLRYGADIEWKTFYSWHALHIAASSGQEGVVEVLLDQGADIEAATPEKWNALHFAARAGNTNVVMVLVACGTDITKKTGQNLDAQSYAASRGHQDVVAILEQAKLAGPGEP